jgi:tRNA pseudouridine32 synthase/23S rRNA pseudouridine746 synthase
MSKEQFFTPFKTSVKEIELPEKFTFPFFYEPHLLAEIASKELQQSIENDIEWNHNFGLDDKEADKGKMFGVLVVQNGNNELGYLRAYSGKLTGMERPKGFVPHVYNLPEGDNFYAQGMRGINTITTELTSAQNSEVYLLKLAVLKRANEEAELEIKAFKSANLKAKKKRKLEREQAEHLSQAEKESLEETLVKQSLQQKYRLRVLKHSWKQALDYLQTDFEKLEKVVQDLKGKRSAASAKLQRQIFDEYKFLNAEGNWKSLHSIFKETELDLPPAGAGECAAPKLLQAAYEGGFKPVALAEFWWGESPTMEIKKHKHFYPACRRKCKPILGHMLKGLSVEANPLLVNYGEGKQLEKVYEDAYMLVVNKPEGLLSVPGKTIQDSVFHRMQTEYSDATGPITVHRLDQDTSGLMLIAKTKEAHKDLQQQFLDKTIKKRYIALLDGEISEKEGIIDLPLRVDINDRPKQMVCHESGKRSITRFKVIEVINSVTRIQLNPITGRSHQLRMHCAHKEGLNTAIVGDNLYGRKGTRLHLHAEFIEFIHPVTKKKMKFSATANF